MKEGLERILAELHDIAFRVVTIADLAPLKVPFSFDRVEFSAVARDNFACGADALDVEDQLDRCIFSPNWRVLYRD